MEVMMYVKLENTGINVPVGTNGFTIKMERARAKTLIYNKMKDLKE